MKRFTLSLVLGILTILPLSALAAETPLTGSMAFDAVGKPSMLKIHGEGKQVSGSTKQEGKVLTGTFSAKLDDLETGIELRNKHMKNKYLEIGKFPEAKFKLDPLSLPSIDGDFKKTPFKGTLTLHGVEKPVSGFADILTKNGIQTVVAEFTTKVGDYGVQSPSFAGVTMADDVNVKLFLKTKVQ